MSATDRPNVSSRRSKAASAILSPNRVSARRGRTPSFLMRDEMLTRSPSAPIGSSKRVKDGTACKNEREMMDSFVSFRNSKLHCEREMNAETVAS